MILDSLKNWKVYFNSPIMDWVFDYLNSIDENSSDSDFQEIEDGRFRIAVMTYITKCRWDSVFESHKKFIDVQFTISGREVIEVCDVSLVKSRTMYDIGKDVIYYYPPLVSPIRVVSKSGNFVVLFPGEVHSAGISVENQQEKVKKAVVKIDWDTFVKEQHNRFE